MALNPGMGRFYLDITKIHRCNLFFNISSTPRNGRMIPTDFHSQGEPPASWVGKESRKAVVWAAEIPVDEKHWWCGGNNPQPYHSQLVAISCWTRLSDLWWTWIDFFLLLGWTRWFQEYCQPWSNKPLGCLIGGLPFKHHIVIVGGVPP